MENEIVNKIIELDIDIEGMDDESLEEYGVEVISLVDDPAIGVDFHYFKAMNDVYEFRENKDCPDGFEHQMPDGSWMCGKEHSASDAAAYAYAVSSSLELDKKLLAAYNKNLSNVNLKKKVEKHTFALNEDKRIATGPLMIPNKMIHRRDEDGGVYYIYFTKDTIRRMAEKFLRLNKHNNTDVDHDFNITTNNTLLESWISEDMMYDKAYKMGFALPMGTWYVSYKINDDETWRRIKEGELKGFSLAGPFIEKMAVSNYNENLLNDIKRILSKIDD